MSGNLCCTASQADPAAFKDASNFEAPSAAQAPYYTSNGLEEASYQSKAGGGGNSLAGVTGKVGTGGNNYSRPGGQNVRFSRPNRARPTLCAALIKAFSRLSRHALAPGPGTLSIRHVYCVAARLLVGCEC